MMAVRANSTPWGFSAVGLLAGVLVAGGAPTGPAAKEAPFPADPAHYSVRDWQVEDGLPFDVVNRVVQDREGFIWAATIGGLVRFDGHIFKTFRSPLLEGPAGRNIRDLISYRDGTLLMLPATGGIVQWTNGVFRLHPASQALASKQLVSLFAEPDGTIWVGTLDGHVARWKDARMLQFGATDGLSSRVWVKPNFARDGQGQVWIADGDFLGVYRDGRLARLNEGLDSPIVVAPGRAGGVWIAGRNQLLKMTRGTFSVVSTNLPWSSHAAVKEMYEARDGVLWVGTSTRGLFRWAEGRFSSVPTSHRSITCIAQDREGDLWVATGGGGMDRVRPTLGEFYNTKSGLLEDVSSAVCADRHGTLWFANRNGGVARLDRGRISVVTFQGARSSLSAQAICADALDQIWVGAESGLYRFPRDHPEHLEVLNPNLRRVHVLFESRDGDMWVAAEPASLGRFHHGRYQAFSEADGFLGSRVRAIEQDAAGTVWIGTEHGELYSWAGDRFTRFTRANGLPGEPVRALHADADGLWIGTIDGGLVFERQGRFQGLSISNGLPDDVITQIQEDGRGRLWCGTRHGIFTLAKRQALDFFAGKISEVNAVTFGKSDGLSQVYCLASDCQPNTWRSGPDQIWFVTQQGVLDLDAGAFQPNPRPPPVLVEGLKVNDQWLAATGAVRVAPCPQRLEFHFAALSYVAPEKVRFKYQLSGVDSDWNETGDGDAVYAGLPPGKYILRVTACNNDGVWNPRGAALSFVVLRAWWQTWWFRAAALLVFAGAIASGVRYWSSRRLRMKLERLEQQQAVERERARIARDLHDDLGASLTQIGLLVEMARRNSLAGGELQSQAAQLASRVRALAGELDAVVWTINPKNDSLDKLVTYICQFSQEFFRFTPIRCRLDVSDEIPAWPLTPDVRHDLFMVMKEAMNNAIKHSGATEVWLRVAAYDGVLKMTLEDNGRGFVPSKNGDARNGLGNMRARLQQMGAALDLQSRPGGGAVVEVHLRRETVSNQKVEALKR
ncbi:MAG: hypothetical protein KGJ60_15915 [Verrucomicrobiota bacterium]|nr:hypothetical protein [Verrucomicrobiota bacterium]